MFIQLRNMFDSSFTDMFFASIQILLQIASKSRLFRLFLDRTRLRVEAGATEAEVWKKRGFLKDSLPSPHIVVWESFP